MNFLSKTRNKLKEVFKKVGLTSSLDQKDIEMIEECLLSADVSWGLTEKILDNINKKNTRGSTWEDALIESIKISVPDISNSSTLLKQIVIIVGVNGTGKTTTSAKLANCLKSNNKNVLLVAADTYRAGAVEQLKIWAERIKVTLIANINSSDPSSVVYDGIKSGLSKNCDHIIVDTAGRLHSSINLMKELRKIYTTTEKLTQDITVLISLDANIGQNGIKQVENFNEHIPIDGIVLNKMDGTAKGGSILSIFDKTGIPISYIGMGEKINDIISFNLNNYLNSLVKEN